MFSTILLVLLAIDSVLLVSAILLQAGKGGGLSANFGGASSSADAIMGTRQAGNLLTKITWWTGSIFVALAFVLSLSSARRNAPRSVLDQTFQAPAAPTTTPAPQQPASNVLPVAPTTVPTPAGADTKSKTPPAGKTP